MRVGIHKSRAKRCIAKVDHACGAGDWQIASCINNLVALHDDHAVLHEGFRFAVEHSRSPECY
jgi:hypothetical protein